MENQQNNPIVNVMKAMVMNSMFQKSRKKRHKQKEQPEFKDYNEFLDWLGTHDRTYSEEINEPVVINYKEQKNVLRRSKRRLALREGIIKLRNKKDYWIRLDSQNQSNDLKSLDKWFATLIKVHPKAAYLTVKNYYIPFEEDLTNDERNLLGLEKR